MFFTDRLMLRAVDPVADLSAFLRIHNEADLHPIQFLSGPKPRTRMNIKDYIGKIATRNALADLPFFVICMKPVETPDLLKDEDDLFLTEGQPRYPMIGWLNFHTLSSFSPWDAVSRFGIGFDAKYRGMGLGTEVLNWALSYSFKTLNLNKLALEVAVSNERALRCYRKVGFKEEGRLREQFWNDGKREDTILMAVLRSEWIESCRLATG